MRICFAPAAVRWMQEAQHWAFAAEEARPGQPGLVMIYRLPQPQEMLRWVLGWGSQAEVLSPEGLRAQVLEEARRMLAATGHTPTST